MKTFNYTPKLLSLAISIALTLAGCAETPEIEAINEELSSHPSAAINTQPSVIYQATRGEKLQDALNKIANRSGIIFRINTDISHDEVTKSISASDWSSAVSQLLEGYNVASVKEGNKIESITIIGRNSLSSKPVVPSTPITTLTITPKNEILPDKYKNFPAGSVTSIDLPLKELMSIKDQTDITLDLPMGKFNVTHDHTQQEIDGSATWVGYLKDEGPGYHVFVSQGEAGVMGHVNTPDGTYNLESEADGTYILDTNKLEHVGFAGDMPQLPVTANAYIDEFTAPIANAEVSTSTATTASSASTASSAKGAPTTEIDIMVLYTTKGMTAAYAKQRIAYLVTTSNQAYIDSKMNLKLRLVYAEPTNYVEDNANNVALLDLFSGNGVFKEVKATRQKVGADLVYLFRPLYTTAKSCGTAFVGFSGNSAGNASLGYGAISDGNALDKKGSLCALNTFTHEIGHSLGLVHNPEDSKGAIGVFADSYALGKQGKFGTIMSYQSPLVMLFSNPQLTTQCAKEPCGYINSFDQLKAVAYTAPRAANFMPRRTNTPIIK